MSDQPVSALIATHDRPELVRTAVRGVLAQDHPGPVEVVVVFDRSVPDPGLERLRSERAWAGPRTVRVLANTRSPGIAGARNTGILASTYPWIGFCDDDDLWLPGKLTAQFRALQNRPAPVCVSGITVVYGGHETDRVPPSDQLSLVALAETRVMAAHPSTVLVSRDYLLEQVGLVDEDIPGGYAEDYDWILRAARGGRITVARAPLVRVGWGSSQFSGQWEAIVDAIDYLVLKHPELSGSRKGLARLQGRRAFGLAALGRRRDARAGARAALRLSVSEPRGYLALAVTTGVVSADRLMDLAHRRGRGI